MKNYSKALLSSAAVALALSTVTEVQAADLALKAGPVASYADWSGAYIGGNVGVARMNTACSALQYEYSCGEYSGQVDTNSGTGILAGGQIGYNFQQQNVVFGVLFEGDWTSLNRTNSAYSGSYNFQSQISWLASFRGKMGLAVGATDIYLTGGPAIAGVKAAFNNTDEGVYSPMSTVAVGWVAGMGIEHKIDQRFSVNAEFLYYDLGNQSGPSQYRGEPYQNSYSFEAFVAKVGFNYHF